MPCITIITVYSTTVLNIPSTNPPTAPRRPATATTCAAARTPRADAQVHTTTVAKRVFAQLAATGPKAQQAFATEAPEAPAAAATAAVLQPAATKAKAKEEQDKREKGRG